MYQSGDPELDQEGNELGKIFVGGTSQETKSEHLREYFSKFGEIEEATIMIDNKTSHSRGFGYVKFKNDSSVTEILAKPLHYVLNKYVDVRRSNINLKGRNRRNLRIFVGGLNMNQNEESLREYFSRFGKVTDVNLMMDRAKKQHRGFAFVGFEQEATVASLIQMHFVQIDGKSAEIKALEPPKYNRKSSSDLLNPILVPGNLSICDLQPVAAEAHSNIQSPQFFPKQYRTAQHASTVNSNGTTATASTPLNTNHHYRLIGYSPIAPGSLYYTPVYETAPAAAAGYLYYSPTAPQELNVNEQNYDYVFATSLPQKQHVPAHHPSNNMHMHNIIQAQQPHLSISMQTQANMLMADQSYPASASGDDHEAVFRAVTLDHQESPQQHLTSPSSLEANFYTNGQMKANHATYRQQALDWPTL